jgi:RHS repeat-associated protein
MKSLRFRFLGSVVVATLLSILSGCDQQQPQSPEPIAVARAALAGAPPVGTGPWIVDQAERGQYIPDAIAVIAEADFLHLVATGSWTDASQASRDTAIAMGEAGNSPAALGVFGTIATAPAGLTVNASTFLVTRDAVVRAEAPNQFQSRDYYFASVNMTGQVGWKGTTAYFAVASNAAFGANVCCGKSTKCSGTDPLAPIGSPPCGPNQRLMCSGSLAQGIAPTGTDVNQGRTSSGLPSIGIKIYTQAVPDYASQPINLGCLPGPSSIAPGCAFTSVSCEGPDLQPPSSNWEATIDTQTGCMGGVTEVFTGRATPRGCTYATSAIDLPAECAGHCRECGNMASPTSTNAQPPFCAYAMPTRGSSICASDSQTIQAIERLTTQLRAQASSCLAEGGVCCGANCVCEQPQGPGQLQICTQCDDQGCTERPIGGGHSSLAPISAAAGQAAPCPTDCTCSANNGSSNCRTPLSSETSNTAPLAIVTPCSGVSCPRPNGAGGGGGGSTGSSGGTGGTGGSMAGTGGGAGSGGTTTNPGSGRPLEVHPPEGLNKPTMTAAGEAGQSPQAPGSSSGGYEKREGRSPKKRQKASAGDPVSLMDGALLLEQTDLSLEGPVLPLEFTRSYASSATSRGSLGSNWTHNWDIRVEFLRKGAMPDWAPAYCAGTDAFEYCLLVHLGNGSIGLYQFDARTNLYLPQAGNSETVREVRDPSPAIGRRGWEMRTPDGTIYTFDADGGLLSLRDRFGNGFAIENEDTPLFALRRHCVATADIGPACRLISIALGMQPYLVERTTQALSINWGVLPEQEAYFNATIGRAGSLALTPFGRTRKRITSVTDDMGRRLEFKYQTANEPDYAADATDAQLLKRVVSPGITTLTFQYSRPTTLPWDWAETFLTHVNRTDVAASSGPLRPAPMRDITYAYDWVLPPGVALDTTTVGGSLTTKYNDYFRAFVGCAAGFKDRCGEIAFTYLTALNPEEAARTSILGLVAASFDNITTITNAGSIELENRYNRDPYALEFDRVVEQRFGSSRAVAPASTSAFTWQTNLPLARFSYLTAGPSSASPTSADRTASLPAAIKLRFPVETEAAELIDNTPLDVGQPNGTTPACSFVSLPNLAAALPGYSPKLKYYDDSRFNANQPAAFTVAPTHQLRRSKLTCDQIAANVFNDDLHNDDGSAMIPVNTTTERVNNVQPDIHRHVTVRVLGHRARVLANANRICAWTRYTDRDGFETWNGLNFQGHVLVSADLLSSGSYRFTEELVSADGLPIIQRKPTQGPDRGYILNRYAEIDVSGNGGAYEYLPGWWTRRLNLIERSEVSPTPVSEQLPNGQWAQVISHYEKFKFEQIYNQLVRTQRGYRTAAAPDSDVANYDAWNIMDYQELNAQEMASVYDALVPWGFWWQRDATGAYDQAVVAWQLEVPLLGTDQNGDAWRGFPNNAPGLQRAKGVPVLGATKSGSSTRLSRLFWSRSGRIAYYQDDLSESDFSYYSLGEYGPTGQSNYLNAGFLAKTRQRRTPPASQLSMGPRTPCALLSGPFQWMLPSSCANPAAELTALGISQEAVDAILSVGVGGSGEYLTTTYAYNATGALSRVDNISGTTTVTRDTDGRPLFASEQTQNTVFQYDARARLVAKTRFDATGGVLARTKFDLDESGDVLASCNELISGACGGFPSVPRPQDAQVVSVSRSGEGLVMSTRSELDALTIFSRDERGLVTLSETQVETRKTTSRFNAYTFDDSGLTVSEDLGKATPATVGEVSDSVTRDSFGRVQSISGSHGEWQYAYLTRGGISRLRMSDVAYPTAASTGAEVTYQYDPWGNVATVELNGTLVHTTHRLPSGIAYARQSRGEEPTFAVSASGLSWMMDPSGDQHIQVTDFQTRVDVDLFVAADGRAKQVTKYLDQDFLPTTWVESGGDLVRSRSATRNTNGTIERELDFDGFETVYERNLAGWALSTTNSKTGAFSQYAYNEGGQLVATQDPLGVGTSYRYSALGELIKESNSTTGRFKTFEYDTLSRLSLTTDDSGSIDRVYSGARLVALKDKNDETLTSFSYDALGRENSATQYNLGLKSKFAEADRRVVSTRTFDAFGRVASETQQIGAFPAQTVTTAWSTTPTRTARALSFPGINGTATWLTHFDGSGRTSRLERTSSGPIGDIQYSWLGDAVEQRTQSLSTSSPLRQLIQFDSLFQSTGQTFGAVDLDEDHHPIGAADGDLYCGGTWKKECALPLFQEAVVRYRSGRVAARFAQFGFPNQAGSHQLESLGVEYSSTGQPQHTYANWGAGQFDDAAVSRVIGAGHNIDQQDISTLVGGSFAGPERRWSYQRDFVGSVELASDDISGDFIEATRSADYRVDSLTVSGTGEPTDYDERGRMLRVGDLRLSWGPQDELVGARTSNGQEQYLYDAMGRLVARGSSTHFGHGYLYDGLNMVAERDLDLGDTIWEATWGPERNQLVDWRSTQASYAVITDARHSVAAAVNSSSRGVTWTSRYSVSGERTISDADDVATCTEVGSASAQSCLPSTGLPFGFGGAWQSAHSGLYWMHNRWYSARLGEFLSPDPLGAQDSFNRYLFAGGDPINKWDPDGLAGEEFELITAAKELVSPLVTGTPTTTSTSISWGVKGAANTMQGPGLNAAEAATNASRAAQATKVARAPVVIAFVVGFGIGFALSQAHHCGANTTCYKENLAYAGEKIEEWIAPGAEPKPPMIEPSIVPTGPIGEPSSSGPMSLPGNPEAPPLASFPTPEERIEHELGKDGHHSIPRRIYDPRSKGLKPLVPKRTADDPRIRDQELWYMPTKVHQKAHNDRYLPMFIVMLHEYEFEERTPEVLLKIRDEVSEHYNLNIYRPIKRPRSGSSGPSLAR